MQSWVFVFIGSADTLYLEKGAKRCHECMRSGEYFTISKCMMVWQATGFHFKIYAFILEKECYSHYDATKINQSGDEETLCINKFN